MYSEKQEEKDSVRENKTGIPDALLRKAEQKSNLSFDDVRVHYNSERPATVQALAYTQGNNIYVGPGQERHLAHELGHIVQQKEGRVSATSTVNGMAVNDDPALEREADAFL